MNKKHKVNRDMEGRFRPAGYVDPRRVAIDKRIAEENAAAERYIAFAKRMGEPDLPRRLGIKKRFGNWYVPYEAKAFFQALALGAAIALTESADKITAAIKAYRS